MGSIYTEMSSKVGNLAKPAPQIWGSEAAPKQLNLNKLSDAGGSKDEDVRRSQKPTFELISVYQDTLDYLREVAKTTPQLLATQEEAAYFASRKKAPKQISRPPPPAPAAIKIPELPQPLQQKPPPKKNNSNEMRHIIAQTFPGYALRESALDDAHAKKMSRLWEQNYLTAQIVVIAFGEVGAGLEFVKNVTRAIDTLIAPAQLIEGSHLEKEGGWDLLLSSPTLKHVLLSPWSTWKSTSLSKHYRQNGATEEHFLGPHKLLLLEPSITYLKNPDRKRTLWQLLNTRLSS